MTNSVRRVRDVVSIKRTIWSNYDKFRTLGVFHLEKNAVLAKVLAEDDSTIARIADECREGGVRWRIFPKYLNKIETALIGGREIIDLTQSEDKALDTIAGMPVADFFRVIDDPAGVKIAFNVNGAFDILAKGNRSGCFEMQNVTLTPETSFTLVNELNAFWEDKYSLAIKSDSLSVAISAEDPKIGKKGSSCIRVYVIEGDKIRIDDLGKYIDTAAMTLWITP